MAYVEAISNGGSGVTAARSGAIRSGYFRRDRVVVTLNGIAQKVEKAGLSVQYASGAEPSTAGVSLKGAQGVIPARGVSVVIGHGTADNALFRGRVISTTRVGVRALEPKPTYHLDVVSDVWALQQATVAGGGIYTNIQPARLVAYLLAQCEPSGAALGITAPFVADLPPLAQFTLTPGLSVADTLEQIAAVAGAQWYLDPRNRIHLFAIGAVDPEPFPTFPTIGLGSADAQLEPHGTLTGVVTTVRAFGAQAVTVAPVWSTDTNIPVSTIEGLVDPAIEVGAIDEDGGYGSDAQILLGGVARSLVYGRPVVVGAGQARLLTSAPSSITSDSFYVCDMVRGRPTPFTLTMGSRKWWTMAGTRFRVDSLTTTSTTANTFCERFFVPAVGVGAPVVVPAQAIPADTLIELTNDELLLEEDISGQLPVLLPVGTPVQAYHTAINSAAVAQVSALTGVTPFHCTRILQQPDAIDPPALIAASSMALTEGAPDNFLTYTLRSRHADLRMGQRVTIHFGALAEPVVTLSASLAVTALRIEFDEMGGRLGPMRHATLGPVQPPTLYRLLKQITRSTEAR